MLLCRACLRKGTAGPPKSSAAQKTEHRLHGRKYISPLLHPTISSWEAEEVRPAFRQARMQWYTIRLTVSSTCH